MFDKNEFIKTYGLSENALEGTGLSWGLLSDIYNKHAQKKADHYWDADIIFPLEHYLQNFTKTGVHFIRARVKKPERTVLRLILEAMQARKEEREIAITLDNYTDHLTDIIGLRLVYLFEPSWKTIHQGIIEKYRRLMYQPPVVFVGHNNPKHVKQTYAQVDKQLIIKSHDYGGRHFEYYLKFENPALDRPYTVELQVKSIFEEACTEVSSMLWVPRRDYSPYIDNNLKVLRELSQQANRIATNTHYLKHKFERDLNRTQTAASSLEKHQQHRAEMELGKFQHANLTTIRRHLKKARTDYALQQLETYLDYFKNRELYAYFKDALTGLQSRFSHHKQSIFQGLVESDESNILFKEITESIQAFIRELEEEKYILPQDTTPAN